MKMQMRKKSRRAGSSLPRLVPIVLPLMGACLYAGNAQAFTFEGETVSGNFDSTVTVGVGIRASKPVCGGIIGSLNGGQPAAPSGAGAPAGCADSLSQYNDQGNLNYDRGSAFTTYIKGTHELMLKLPSDVKFLGRVSWLRDFSADSSTGYVSAGGGSSFPGNAASQLRNKTRLLDLWVSKEFSIGDQRARLRVGNQVVNWGESLFIPGGINQTNAFDLMRLSQPGTQMKEAVLPAPMVNFATGLGHGLSIETYVQQGWQRNYFPPVGSYWSIGTIGNGAPELGLPTTSTPRSSGQYGVALRYSPKDTEMNFGLYLMNYHDKSPVMSTSTSSLSGFGYSYLQDRKMIGASMNFPVGNWAVGTELSYRPKDPITLNTSMAGNSPTTNGTGCLANGNCYVETAKYQWAVTGLLSMTPSDNPTILKALGGADTATLMAEAVAIYYPNMKRSYQGIPVAAGNWGWGYDTTANALATGAGTPPSVGTALSYGYNLDFSWVYDGSLIPGWQVVPEVFYFQALHGRTPNFAGTFMQGAKSANFIVSFIQNPAKWQFSLNYAMFWGGDTIFDQPLRGRNFVGATATYNF
ncbi:DUF1302 domain-containing protein [Herbaspirillum rubrisubalbicans]|uniref:DUF1302 domain-containing protein n=1 Tax=Herbaspirillum rubrisubalbicans TaxID=80842 RepID=UPI001559F8F0|nr:DUF1302 domain-containing protein [Herbaspirillum rubrisubalbicans]